MENGEIRHMFCAGEISKINYQAFGDVLAFDATYQTNKYNLIFVPFTGVDNNKRCVTFGAGLLFCETIEAYTWLLRAFLDAHNKQPTLVLTDQDPAMRQAVAAVFDRSLHRLCMWHIMKKLPAKVTGEVVHNTEFRAALHKLVWNIYIKSETFEMRWGKLLEKYGLEDHEWVPAYFREIPMSCLMKTTSRCESSNSAFKVNSSWANTLVQFFLCYDSMLESQRYRQRVGDFKADDRAHEFKSGLAIEKHCALLYSPAIFVEVRKEILKGLLHCYTTGVEEVDGRKIYTVTHLDKRSDVVNEITVKVDPVEDTTTCSCNLWCRIGYLCRHIFCVFRQTKVDEIPAKYVLSRWGRHVLPKSVFRVEFRYGVDLSPVSLTKNTLVDCFSEALQAVMGDRAAMEDFIEKIKGWTKELNDDRRGKRVAEATESQVMADMLGVVVEGSSPRPPNQTAKAKTVQVWSPEQMSLVSNPDTCWLPIQRDGGDSGVQVWDRRRLEMNSDPGLVCSPGPVTQVRGNFGSPPARFASPPRVGVAFRPSQGAAFRTPPSEGGSERSKGKQPMTQVWVPKATKGEVTYPYHGCKGAAAGSDTAFFSWGSDCDSDLD
ncbi:protein FAR1-RELATED SEQUENCE 5-like [Helianthus annuus]|uniref:protein FAR1-RELATED SEQUENCE 5-like n=1 Tax=Helianthus annuus TaxID=4232 RepID=UPI000B8F0356|nr:protein FAR1-RELATED SEQUENCE 5-like [Helianthus annuus]